MALVAGQLDNRFGSYTGGSAPYNLDPTIAVESRIWEPQAGPQALAIGAPFVTEMLFGGARGGGKSDFLLGDFLQDIHLGPVWCGIIFRKSYPELDELIKRAKQIYLPLGATYKVADRTFVFPSGATLKFRHMDTENDADLYQGHQYTWIGFDEITNWPSLAAYRKLKACLRSAFGVANKRIRCSGNPGGPGHHEVKAYFVDHFPKGMQLIEHTDEEGKTSTRMFIPSRVYDNKILMQNDPEYISRLRELGSPELVKAWLEGDWNVITGAYFPEFKIDTHVLEPFPIPAHWLRFRSMDWGSTSPFCVLWHAVSDGFMTPDGKWIPPGAIITYREWYGMVEGKVNVGIKWTANQIGRGIVAREAHEHVSYGVIDPSAFKWDGGPSHAERMAQEGAFFRQADNNRLAGWDTCRDRLCGIKQPKPPKMVYNTTTGVEYDHPLAAALIDGVFVKPTGILAPDNDNESMVGEPMWYCFKTCTHLIRTLPALQHDLDKPEDCDTKGEDHAPDTLRYGLMSRPWMRPKAKKTEGGTIKLLQTATMQDIWDDYDAHEGRHAA